MCILSKLSPEQKEQAKNCKSKEELQEYLEDCGALTVDELDAVAGGRFQGSRNKGCPHPDWDQEFCCNCPDRWGCPGYGDTRGDVKPEYVSRAFALGEISGAGFFA